MPLKVSPEDNVAALIKRVEELERIIHTHIRQNVISGSPHSDLQINSLVAGHDLIKLDDQGLQIILNAFSASGLPTKGIFWVLNNFSEDPDSESVRIAKKASYIGNDYYFEESFIMNNNEVRFDSRIDDTNEYATIRIETDADGHDPTYIDIDSGYNGTSNVRSITLYGSKLNFYGLIGLPDSSSVTIASGSITVTTTMTVVDTEGAAATDDLDTITAMASGSMLILKTANNSRDVVVKHGTGNIYLDGGTDKTLDNVYDRLFLISDGTRWLQLAFSSNS